MGLTGILRWTNPPSTGALETIAHTLIHDHQATLIPKQKYHLYISSHRAVFPSTEPPNPSSQHERLLFTVSSSSSPYVYALIENGDTPSSLPPSFDANPDPSATSAEDKAPTKQLMVALTPPNSLNNLLLSLKSPFVVGNLNQSASSSAKQGIDMGGGSSDRTSKPKINNVRIEGHCFEILAEEPSPSALDGKREVEWKIRVGYVSGSSGGQNRGVIMEVEYVLPSASSCTSSFSSTPPITTSRLEAFMISLLPPILDLKWEIPRVDADGWRTIGVLGNASVGWEDDPRATGPACRVESGRRGAYGLISALRKEGMI